MVQAKPRYTKEKAVHLVRVYIAMGVMGSLIGWMHVVILTPLRAEKLEMAHLDPSEIIATPFSLARISAFATVPTIIAMLVWMYQSPTMLMTKLLKLVKLVAVVYGMLGLCGAQIVNYHQQSLWASLYLATILSTTWTGKETSNLLEELPFYDGDLLGFCCLYGTLLTMIPFSILRVLDRGFQIQRWPLPVVLGGTYGYAIGTAVGLLLLSLARKSQAAKA